MKTGDTAKDFDLPGVDGGRIRLFDKLAKASPLCVVFYKFNCPTCQFTFPHLGRVAKRIGAEHFLAVAQDSPKEAADFRLTHSFQFDIACDEKPYPVSRAYDLLFVPTMIVIEADKTISHVAEGFDKKAIEDFAAKIASINHISSFQAFDPSAQVPLLKPG